MLLRTSVIALALLTANTAAAQEAPFPDRLTLRRGLFVEASPFVIGLSRSRTEETTETGLVIGGSLVGGVFLDSRTAIGLRIDNATNISEIEFGADRTSQRLSVAVLGNVDRYLSDEAWIGAAVGYAWLVDVVSDASDPFGDSDSDISSAGGLAGSLRAGYDIYPLRRGALRLAVDGSLAFIDDSTVVTVTLMAGFHIY